MVDQEIGDHERAKIWIRLRVNGSEQGREDGTRHETTGTIKSGLTGSKAAPPLDPFYAYVPIVGRRIFFSSSSPAGPEQSSLFCWHQAGTAS
jgi:hypothetical protein